MPRRRKRKTIGWREWVALPDLGVREVKAKVDTGADNSSLHAFNLERYEEDGRQMVRFEIHPHQRKKRPSVACVAEIAGERMVKNPGGRAERRPFIRTKLVVAGEEFEALVNLTTRDEMTFRMLLGRRTVRGQFVVDPGRSYVGGRPSRRDNAMKDGE
ncbi:MAG TPA: RimK/LysX family protein [Acidimicrobiia bacterium]|nr:RimK/LysX family protein [Acidimicrobiia bacterium]